MAEQPVCANVGQRRVQFAVSFVLQGLTCEVIDPKEC